MTKRKKKRKKAVAFTVLWACKNCNVQPDHTNWMNVFLATRSLSHQCQENISCHLCSMTIIPDWHLTTCYKNRTLPTLLWRRRMAFFLADSRQSSIEILRKCFSVPWLSDFLAFHLLLYILQMSRSSKDSGCWRSIASYTSYLRFCSNEWPRCWHHLQWYFPLPLL